MPKSNLLSEVFVHKYLWVVATRIVDNNKTDESISFLTTLFR